MADHGNLINSRTYWQTGTDARGRPIISDTPPGGPSRPLGGLIPGISPAPASTQYQEQAYEDGTKVVSRWDPAQDQWVQESVAVDPQIRAQHQATQPKPGAAPTVRTFPDGSLRRWDPAAKDGQGDWVVEQAKPATATAPTVHTLADGSQVQWNPTTQQWTPMPGAKTTRTITAPELGSTVELNALEDEAQQFIDGLYADASLTDAERSRRYQAWRQTVFNPKVQRAIDEAKARAAAVEQRAQETAARQARGEERLQTTAERQAQTEADRLALEQQKYVYGAGQDAVSNALKLLPYAAGPTFASDLAGAYNTILGASGWRSGGSFSPGAFAI